MKYHLSIEVMPQVKLVQPELYMAEELYYTIKENFSHLAQFLDFLKEDMTIADESAYLKMMLQQQVENKGRLFLIYHNDKLIGTVDLHKIDNQNKKAEIGYWIAKGYTGKSIITTCVNYICEFSFEVIGLNKLIIMADVRNKASKKVAEKVGFSFVATDLEDVFDGESYRDMNRYILLRKDYFQHRSQAR
ncbi:GNAT family N-acetyltransferase [Staphylococcus casei]|uniref:GNAT family N-acetyltransferase n=1 Tax=Staphylococcus TaxID=1279 RepID=UPI000CD0A4B5|nr:GNAT family protein [Staphylococcus casei]PNZ59553.1 GNAT family N-acetyltransferase [Staphylococcus casei]PTI80260.1 N-acetyltransferase [Staphylococcus succinus]WJE86758.1 GNAT family protein [Staphylococcus casei]